MSKPVNGFLAQDGSFFENEPECQRYEAERDLATLCDTHEINYENFMATLNAWHSPIGRYYDADNKCEVHQVGRAVRFEEYSDSSLSSTEGDIPNPPSGDKDSPGFLEQSLRRHF
jgi:hypothetical protein